MTSATLSPDTAAPHRAPAPRRIPTPRSARVRRILAWIAEHAVLVVLAVLFIAPVVFVLLTSLMSSEQTLTASLWPQPFQWDNYVKVFTTVPLAQWFANSALYAVLATAFMLVSSVPAAYALAKIRFRGSGVLFTVIIIAMLLPPQVTAIPIYVIWSQPGLTGTLWPLILPNLLKERAASKTIRIWSAACSSSQEAYSLAMILSEMGAQLSGWRIDIIGTDLSTEILGRAKDGVYSQFEVQRGLPITLLVKYFQQSGDRWQINQKIRSMVQYREFNLLQDPVSLGRFDVVFCRNVLIYFDQPTKAKVLNGIAKQMPDDGYLILGGAETVLGLTDRFQLVPGQRGVYCVSTGEGKTTTSFGLPPRPTPPPVAPVKPTITPIGGATLRKL